MSDDAGAPALPDGADADVSRSRFNIIWLIPAVAVLLGGWLLVKSVMNRVTAITIAFQTADGLEEGKTAIRFRSVNLGLVDSIDVADDRSHVVVHATVHPTSKHLLSDKTRFWVVRPRATLQGISGLGTLLSGAYIAVDPEDGKPQTTFTGLEDPPMIGVDEVGRRFQLKARELGSISEGSPVYFRGIPVGEVLRYALDGDGMGVTIEIFVHAPHPARVMKRTRFWNASGIEATLNADGIKIRTESLEALALGGVAFDNPPGKDVGAQADEGAVFRLHPDRDGDEKTYTDFQAYVCYFEDSIRGLSVGAPIEFRGFQIGVVAAIAVERDPVTDLLRMPVTLHLQPERFGETVDYDDREREARLALFMQKGLRAQLKSGNLLTGQMLVDLVMAPDAPPRLVGGDSAPHPELATIPGTFAGMEKSVAHALATLDAIMTKVDELPLQELVQNAADAAGSIEKLANSEELNGAIATAHQVLKDVEPAIDELKKLLRDSDEGIKSIVHETELTAKQLREVLAQADQALVGVNSFVSPDCPIQVDLVHALSEMRGAARSFRLLMEYLDRHPEALLSGKSGTGGR